MGDILKGETFVDGQSVNGARLNSLVDNAQIQPDLITNKPSTTPVGGDQVLIRQASTGLLKKSTITQINNTGGNVTSVGLVLPSAEFNVAGSPVTGAGIITGAWTNKGGNKVFASPANGTTGTPLFRDLVPSDLRIGSVLIPGNQIDWAASNTFRKTLGADITFTFVNHLDGDIRYAAIAHATFRAHWPVEGRWPGGVEPDPTAGTSIFKFAIIGGLLYGWLEAENCF